MRLIHSVVAFTSAVPASPKVGGSYAVTTSGGASGNPVVISIDAAAMYIGTQRTCRRVSDIYDALK
jgi:hypothetical protein